MDKPMTDEEKNEKCIRETGYPCTVVPQSLYDAAVAWGVDVTRFVPDKPCPVEHVITIQHKLPSSAEMREELKRKLEAGELLGAEHVKTDEEKAAYRSEFERIIAAGGYSTLAYDYHGTPYVRAKENIAAILTPCEYTLDAGTGKIWKHAADLLKEINRSSRKGPHKDCSYGVACMPGRNGKCTACAMDEK